MRNQIIDHLSRLEREHGIEILLAVEAGSRAWGFHSPDSDYDVRFIYRRPLAWYLSIHERRDVIEPHMDFPLDFSGWDIRKALFQMYRGNPQLFEWLRSPVEYVHSSARDELLHFMGIYFNPRSAIYHYLHMAAGNYGVYIRDNATPRLKKYLYVVRPLLACMWIEQQHTMPPVEFDELFGGVPLAAMQCVDIWTLLEAKRAGDELGEGQPLPALNAWIEEKLAHFGKAARTTAKGPTRTDDVDEYFYNSVAFVKADV